MVQRSRFFHAAFQAMLASFTLTALLVVFHALARHPDSGAHSVSGVSTGDVASEPAAEPIVSDIVKTGRTKFIPGKTISVDTVPDPPVTVLDPPDPGSEPAFSADPLDDPFLSDEGRDEAISSDHDDEQDLSDFEPLLHETDAKLTRIETQLAEIDGRIAEFSQTSSSRQAQLLLQAGELLEAVRPRTPDPFAAAETLQHGQPISQSESLQTQESPFDTQQEEQPPFDAEQEADSPPDGPDREPALKITPSENEPGLYSLEIRGAEISQVLTTLGELGGLNVLVGKGVEGSVTANLQDVSITEAIDAILESHGYVAQQEEGLVYALSDAIAEAQRQDRRRPAARTYQPGYVDARKLRSAIEPLLTEGIGTAVVTGPANAETIPEDRQQPPPGATLLVRDYDEVLQEINRIVAEMDVPPRQVVIDTMVLKVTLRDGIRLGMNSSLFERVYRQMLVAGPNAGIADREPPAGEPSSDSPHFAETQQEAGGLQHGVLQGERRTFLEALKSIGQVHLITSTQLPVLDRHEALLTLGNRFALPDESNSNTAAAYHTADTSLRLAVRPRIAPGGMIRLDVRPEQYHPDNGTPTVTGELTTTGLSASSIVSDGATVVVGGLYNERVEWIPKRRSVFGALPWKKNRQHPARLVRDELILLLTPRVVVDERRAHSTVSAPTTSR